MYPVSERFLARIAESHTVVTRVQLFLTTGEVIDLPHTGGSVTVDRGQAIRRTCTVTCPDPSIIPRTPSDQLATYGARLLLRRGVDYGDGGQPELVPLGLFRLDSVDGDVSDGPVTLQGKDLSAIVADDKFTTPYTATGTAVGAVTALIRRSLPDAQVISTVVDVGIGRRTFDVEGEVYANADGEFTIATLPDLLTTEPAWEIAAAEHGVYISARRAMSSENVFNGVLARGENAAEGVLPVSYLATDDDPGSPTYWDGPFGRRPAFYSSSTLISTLNCQNAAKLKLLAAKAPNASGDITALPNPALEPGDVLRILHPDGTRELHQAAAFTVPLDEAGDFPISTIAAKEGS